MLSGHSSLLSCSDLEKTNASPDGNKDRSCNSWLGVVASVQCFLGKAQSYKSSDLQKQHHQILLKSHATECFCPAISARQMSVKSDQSANEALLAPAEPTKTSRGNKILCTSGIIPLKLPRKSNVRTVWVLHWKDSLEENIQRVKHKWRTTQHFM